jgi:uncharacterized membrane protein
VPETVSPTGLANLPPIATTNVGSMRFLTGWLQGPARWIGWLVIPLVPVFIFTTVAVYEFLAQPCYDYSAGYSYFDRGRYDQGCLNTASFTMGAVSMVYVLFAGLCLASAYAIMTRPAANPKAAETATRLQGIKDWFIRGDIQEEDYQNLRKLLEGADDAKSPGQTARRGATLLTSFAFFLLPLGLFWAIFIGVFTDELGFWDEEFAIFLNFIVGGLLLAALFTAALIRASQLRRFGKTFGDSLLRQIDSAEEAIMRSARARTGARDAMPTASGASYRPYAKR